MLRMAIWLLAGIASIALTVMMFFPATWMASMVEKQTAGRLTLGDARGTLWRGSAFIGGAKPHPRQGPLLCGWAGFGRPTVSSQDSHLPGPGRCIARTGMRTLY